MGLRAGNAFKRWTKSFVSKSETCSCGKSGGLAYQNFGKIAKDYGSEYLMGYSYKIISSEVSLH
jgi:hypothetical protein